MQELRFQWAGLNCLARGGAEDGIFIADSISVIGDLDIDELSSPEWDKLYNLMDKEYDKVVTSLSS